MSKRKKIRVKGRAITKETASNAKVIVQELNVISANRHYKDVGEYRISLDSAERPHYPNRTRLYDLYDDVVLDGQVSGCIDKRIDAILNKTLIFQNSAKKHVDEMDEVIGSNNFRKLIRQIILSKLWGISGLEFVPGAEIEFLEIPRKHIKPEIKVITKEQSDYEGIPYEGISNVWVIGEDKDLGLLLKASLYALYKRGTLGDYAQYIEIFGQPVRIVYYDAYDTKTKDELRKTLDESGSSLAMMIPKQAQFEMKDGKQSNGDGNLQFKFLSYLDDQVSIVILGNTETTQASASSGYAQSKEHGKQQLQITKSDLKFVENLLNSKKFMAILKSYGLNVEGGRFAYEKEIDLTELRAKAEVDKIVIETYKVPVSDDYVYKTFGIEKPENYDELKAKQEADKLALQQQKEDPAPEPPAPKDKKAKPAKPKSDKLSDNYWQKLRTTIADFFDPAP